MTNVYNQALLDDIARQHELPMPLLKEASRAILSTIHDGLQRDGVVRISHFGTFRLKAVAARKGINPQTRESITIPAHQRVIFSPGKALRERIQPAMPPPIPLHSTATHSDHRETELSPKEQPQRGKTAKTTEPAASRGMMPLNIAVDKEEATNVVTVDTASATLEAGEKELNTVESPGVKQSAPSPEDNRESHQTSPDDIDLGPFEQSAANESPDTKTNRAVIVGTLVAVLLLSALTLPYLLARFPSSPGQNEGNKPLAAEKRGSISPLSAPDRIGNKSPDITSAPTLQTTEKQGEDIPPAHSAKQNTRTQDSQVASTPVQQVNATPESLAPDTPTTTGNYYFTATRHRLVSGDSLWRLAARNYHDPLLWPHIYQANTDRIDNPDFLREGRSLIIPTLQGSPDALTQSDRHNIAEGYYMAYRYYRKAGQKDALFALLEAKRYGHSVVAKKQSRER